MGEQLESQKSHLAGISPRAYQHPADRAAAAGLSRVPYLDEVVRRLVALGYERALRTASLGSSVRLGERQLPDIWQLHREVIATLEVEPLPDLYLTAFPMANAMTVGTSKPIVIMNSELVRLLEEPGRRAVLAHEAAHIHSDHVLYGTALRILIQLGTGGLGVLAGLPLMAIRLALLDWFRSAELSCDRGAALVTRDPESVCRTLMVLSAGEAAAALDLDAFIAQASDYTEGGQGVERLTKLFQDLHVTHPMPVRRVKALLDWVREGDYDRILGGDYERTGEEAPLRDDLEAAGAHYTDRAAEAFQVAGSSITEIGDQLKTWLDKQRA